MKTSQRHSEGTTKVEVFLEKMQWSLKFCRFSKLMSKLFFFDFFECAFMLKYEIKYHFKV